MINELGRSWKRILLGAVVGYLGAFTLAFALLLVEFFGGYLTEYQTDYIASTLVVILIPFGALVGFITRG